MTKYTEFPTAQEHPEAYPRATVRVTDADDCLDKEDVVQVNWSCCGMRSVEQAEEFLAHLRKALAFARRNQRRHAKRAEAAAQTQGWCDVISKS